MEAFLATIALLLIALILIYQFLTWHFNLWHRLGLPGPRPRILRGNFPSLLNGKRNIVYDYEDLYNAYKKLHPAIGIFIGRDPEILILDPKLAHDIMVTSFGKYRDNHSKNFIMNPNLDKFASRNAFFTAEDWKTRRSNTLTGVTANRLSLAYPIWKENAQKLSKFLEEKTTPTGHATLESKDLVYRFTANVVSDFLWGIDAGTFTDSSVPNTIMQTGTTMLTQSFKAIVFYHATIFAPIVRRFSGIRFFPAATDNFFSKITKDAIAMRLKDKNSKRIDFLNYIIELQEKKNLSHDDAMGAILTVFLDGYETSANIIFHTLLNMARHPRVQEKLRAEILANVESDGFMNFETLNNIPYLDQCVNETIRIISPIQSFSRICTETTSIEIAPHKHVPVNVGTVINIPVFSYHHDPEYFPEPYVYRPERFDNAAHVELTKRGIFMPFGDGPRICLGMRAGLLLIKTFLVELLQKYRIMTCSQTIDTIKPDSQWFVLGYDGDIVLQYERL